jgi:hypothetical protein
MVCPRRRATKLGRGLGVELRRGGVGRVGCEQLRRFVVECACLATALLSREAISRRQ